MFGNELLESSTVGLWLEGAKVIIHSGRKLRFVKNGDELFRSVPLKYSIPVIVRNSHGPGH